MEAKVENREIIDRVLFTVENNQVHLEYHYKSPSKFLSNKPSLAIISFDGELSDYLVKTIIDEYSGEYKVFHTFKTDKLYISDVTLYMKELFNVENKEVTNE